MIRLSPDQLVLVRSAVEEASRLIDAATAKLDEISAFLVDPSSTVEAKESAVIAELRRRIGAGIITLERRGQIVVVTDSEPSSFGA